MSHYVIVGGSSGIGLALADMLSENNDVLVISRNASEKACYTNNPSISKSTH